METLTNTEFQVRVLEKLGSVQSDVCGVKASLQGVESDIADLKKADEMADERLERAYAKAMTYASTRQDAIKTELQLQIDANRAAIADFNKAISNLSKNIQSMMNSSETNWRQKFDVLETKVNELVNKPKDKISARWQQVKDKLFSIGLMAVIIAVVFYAMSLIAKVSGAPLPVPPDLPLK